MIESDTVEPVASIGLRRGRIRASADAFSHGRGRASVRLDGRPRAVSPAEVKHSPRVVFPPSARKSPHSRRLRSLVSRSRVKVGTTRGQFGATDSTFLEGACASLKHNLTVAFRASETPIPPRRCCHFWRPKPVMGRRHLGAVWGHGAQLSSRAVSHSESKASHH